MCWLLACCNANQISTAFGEKRVSVGSVTRIRDQCGRIGRPGSVTTKHGSVTGPDGSVARSPGSVTGGIAKTSETKEADHTGSVARINHKRGLGKEGNGKQTKTNHTRIGHRRGLQKVRKTNQANQTGSVTRIGHQRGVGKAKKRYQTSHTGSVARIGHQRGLGKARKTNQPTIPDRSPGSVTREV